MNSWPVLPKVAERREMTTLTSAGQLLGGCWPSDLRLEVSTGARRVERLSDAPTLAAAAGTSTGLVALRHTVESVSCMVAVMERVELLTPARSARAAPLVAKVHCRLPAPAAEPAGTTRPLQRAGWASTQ